MRGLDATNSVDFKLIDWALGQERPVYLQGRVRTEFLRHPASGLYTVTVVKETFKEDIYKVIYSGPRN